MYRIVKMTNKVYAVDIGYFDNIDDELENIRIFVESGDVVMLSEELDSVAELLEIKEDEIEVVEIK